MSQSRAASALESVTNMTVGVLIGATINYAVLPMWGFNPTMADSIGMTAMFAGISLVRSYVTRRVFNWWSDR